MATDLDRLTELGIQQAILVHDRNLAVGVVKPGDRDVVKWMRQDGERITDWAVRLRRMSPDGVEIDYVKAVHGN